jgi:hypothetical protein
MVEGVGQMWQWMGQMPVLWMVPVLIVATAVAFVLMARDARAKKPAGLPR